MMSAVLAQMSNKGAEDKLGKCLCAPCLPAEGLVGVCRRQDGLLSHSDLVGDVVRHALIDLVCGHQVRNRTRQRPQRAERGTQTAGHGDRGS